LFWGIFIYLNVLINSKITKIPPGIRKISGLGQGYLDIFVFSYILKLHMYLWMQDVEFIVVRGIEVF
jgi:hypothetical protein